jgi:hypothetical protein
MNLRFPRYFCSENEQNHKIFLNFLPRTVGASKILYEKTYYTAEKDESLLDF